MGSLLLVIGVVLAKVGLLQGGQGAALRASAVGAVDPHPYPCRRTRGSIFDRNGDELALSVPAATVAVNPRQIEDVAGTVDDPRPRCCDMTPEQAAGLQAAIEASDSGFLYVARQIDPAIAEQIDELGCSGSRPTPRTGA